MNTRIVFVFAAVFCIQLVWSQAPPQPSMDAAMNVGMSAGGNVGVPGGVPPIPGQDQVQDMAGNIPMRMKRQVETQYQNNLIDILDNNNN